MLSLSGKTKHCSRHLEQGEAFGEDAKQHAYKVILDSKTFHVIIDLVSFTISSDDTCFYHRYELSENRLSKKKVFIGQP